MFCGETLTPGKDTCRWWEQDKGKGVIRQVTAAMGAQRRADNTVEMNKPRDDYENFGLLGDDTDDQAMGALKLQEMLRAACK